MLTISLAMIIMIATAQARTVGIIGLAWARSREAWTSAVEIPRTLLNVSGDLGKHWVMLVMCIQRGWQRLETPVPGTQLPPSTIVHSRNENKNSIVFPVRPSEEIIEKVIVANQGCP